MPDNTSMKDASNATVNIATDDVSSVFFQKVKLDFGGDGVSVPVETSMPVVGRALSPTATFTRPANTTAYASGQLVANSTTAGSVTAMSVTAAATAAGSFMLRRIKLAKSSTGITNAAFRVHAYTSAPTAANGDGGTYSTNGVANYLGAFDVVMDRAFTDGACGIGAPVVGSDLTVKLASGSTIVFLIEARAAYTPTSAETFTLTLDAIQGL